MITSRPVANVPKRDNLVPLLPLATESFIDTVLAAITIPIRTYFTRRYAGERYH